MDELHHELGIWGRLRLHRLDPLYVLRGAGREVTAHAGWFGWEAELIRNFPGEADGGGFSFDELLHHHPNRVTDQIHTNLSAERPRSSDRA